MKFHLYSLILLVFFIFSNCMTNIEDVSGGDDFDPNDISYSSDIQPIFNTTCGNSGCHITNSTNGVNLSSYNSVMNSIGTQYGTEIVEPDEPENSPLVDKIEPNPENGSRMPLNRGPLSTTDINKIKAWIEGGAENN